MLSLELRLLWRFVQRQLTSLQAWVMQGRLIGALQPHLQKTSTDQPLWDNQDGVPIQPKWTLMASWESQPAKLAGAWSGQLLMAGTFSYPFRPLISNLLWRSSPCLLRCYLYIKLSKAGWAAMAASSSFSNSIKQTTWNDLLWHCHVSSLLLKLWLMCVCKFPALVKSITPTPTTLLAHDSHLCISDHFFPHDYFGYLIIVNWNFVSD